MTDSSFFIILFFTLRRTTMISESELMINNDGSIFHLHLVPDQLARKIILVGDPARVDLVLSHFSTVEFKIRNREFYAATGTCNHTRITVLSSGIGTDNIDIVMNELDALANVDFTTRTARRKLTFLEIMRIGTSGGIQPDLPLNSFVVSEKAVGFDGLVRFYAGREQACDLEFEQQIIHTPGWDPALPPPYVVDAAPQLLAKFNTPEFTRGVTLTAPGFYGPQGRQIRIPLKDPQMNDTFRNFRYKNYRFTNYEMESSAIYGLSRMLGHQAITVCAIIANRMTGETNPKYKPLMKKLIETALNRFITR
jgi:uridine phosphorylase